MGAGRRIWSPAWSLKLLIAKYSVVFSLTGTRAANNKQILPINYPEETSEPVGTGRRDPGDTGQERSLAPQLPTLLKIFFNMSKLNHAALSRNLTVGCIFKMGVGISQKQCSRSHLKLFC